ncbi:MAG TPA: thioesterase family protein [Thermoanaerobaculia bacterium]|nr:thioesterase family protein [Thermoanaerobaculia bacterium]
MALPIQWGEMDSYGHVNNAVYFRWFESARMEYFRRLGWPELERETGVGPILHSTRARFRAPLEWPDTVEVLTRAGEVEADRFTMFYEVRSPRFERAVCEGSGIVVAYDYRSKSKTALPEAIRRRIAALESGPAEE